MISQIVHAETKHPLNVVVPGISPNSYNVLAVASARIYHAPLSYKNAEWCYSRLRGTLVLGKDSVQAGDSKELGSIDIGIVDAEDNWFRLLDADSGKLVWMFRFHAGLSYQQDRPFFHVFQGRVSNRISRSCPFLLNISSEEPQVRVLI
jgi:Wiskott-Aldrich syndrome protein